MVALPVTAGLFCDVAVAIRFERSLRGEGGRPDRDRDGLRLARRERHLALAERRGHRGRPAQREVERVGRAAGVGHRHLEAAARCPRGGARAPPGAADDRA